MALEFSLSTNIFIFILSASIIWYACNKLADVVEYIDLEFGLGNAFGGALILSVVTNLPEVAIAIASIVSGNYGLITGNLLGGIAIQNLLLVLFDFYSKDSKPLASLVSSRAGILQGLSLVFIIVLCFIAGKSNMQFSIIGANWAIWLVLFVWLFSLYLVGKFEVVISNESIGNLKDYTRKSSLWILLGISIVVLFFGVLLSTSSDAIANHFNMSGIFFGATILALVTSLPEISSGLKFVKNKDYAPILSDIFGGNIFLPVLLLPASVFAGKNIISNGGKSNDTILILAFVISIIFIVGMWLKSSYKKYGLGFDSWLMLLVGILGFVMLYYVSE